MGQSISLEYPPGFILLCLIAGLLYAWIGYARSAPWSNTLNKILFALRTIVISVLAFLLLSPVLRQITNHTERPAVVIAVDNSQSIPAIYDSAEIGGLLNKISKLVDKLKSDNYDVELYDLDNNNVSDASFSYNSPSTNLDNVLQNVENKYEGRNLQEVVLFSDGIYNEGISPSYRNYPYPVSTVGLGDSIPKKDIFINSLMYNKIAYQGNRFPLVATIGQNGFAGQKEIVSVIQSGRKLASKEIILSEDGVPQDVEFLIDAAKVGYQQYEVSLQHLDEEFIEDNNHENAFIEIVEGKQKINLVAASPHPDLKAIVSSLETSQNYEVRQFILSLPEDRQKLLSQTKKADLLILHQLPSARVKGMDWSKLLNNQSALIVYGPMTDINELSGLLPWMNMQQVRGEFDKITGVPNPNFSAFSYSDKLSAMMSRFPPIVAPFGDITTQGDIAVMLYQRVGSIQTEKPLLAIESNSTNKSAVFLASGIWQWKLMDYAENHNNEVFNEFITKLVQYLASKDDKRRFRVYPVKNEFNVGEDVVFETEVYNELYERIFGYKINLEVTSPDGGIQKFNYVTSQNNSHYRISGLEQGVYKYKASTTLEGQVETVSGQLAVTEKDLEMINLTANFGELRELSNRTGGSFYPINKFDELLSRYSSLKASGIIHSEERYLPAINIFWLFLLILVMITLEWGLRKYHGSY